MALEGRLRHTVAIQRAALGPRGEYGAKAQTWTTLAIVKAWVQPVQRDEQGDVTGGGPVSAGYLAFLMPTDVREADRIVWSGDTYAIESVVNPAGKDHHLELRLSKTTT